MSFKDQLRNYFICCWHDFWFVPPRQLLIFLGYAAWGIGLLVWRIQTVFTPPAWFRTLDSLFSLLLFALWGTMLYKKLRTFYNEKMR